MIYDQLEKLIEACKNSGKVDEAAFFETVQKMIIQLHFNLMIKSLNLVSRLIQDYAQEPEVNTELSDVIKREVVDLANLYENTRNHVSDLDDEQRNYVLPVVEAVEKLIEFCKGEGIIRQKGADEKA